MTTIETDYLIIGGGAVGLAFADTIIAETDAHVTIIDRQAKPGGHWNDAYGFVALHQPSAFYGVNSLPLGENRKDTHGANAGLYELASGGVPIASSQPTASIAVLPAPSTTKRVGRSGFSHRRSNSPGGTSCTPSAMVKRGVWLAGMTGLLWVESTVLRRTVMRASSPDISETA